MFKCSSRVKVSLFIYLFLACLCQTAYLAGSSDTPEITFTQLSEWHAEWSKQGQKPTPLVSLNGQTVKIRGFIYQQKNGQWILSAMPNVKSCCLDNNQVTGVPLLLAFNSIQEHYTTAISLEGNLYSDEKEDLTKSYRLEAAQVLEKSKFSWVYAIVLISLFTAVVYIFLKK